MRYYQITYVNRNHLQMAHKILDAVVYAKNELEAIDKCRQDHRVRGTYFEVIRVKMVPETPCEDSRARLCTMVKGHRSKAMKDLRERLEAAIRAYQTYLPSREIEDYHETLTGAAREVLDYAPIAVSYDGVRLKAALEHCEVMIEIYKEAKK